MQPAAENFFLASCSTLVKMRPQFEENGNIARIFTPALDSFPQIFPQMLHFV
jgi:hypothetical protein